MDLSDLADANDTDAVPSTSSNGGQPNTDSPPCEDCGARSACQTCVINANFLVKKSIIKDPKAALVLAPPLAALKSVPTGRVSKNNSKARILTTQAIIDDIKKQKEEKERKKIEQERKKNLREEKKRLKEAKKQPVPPPDLDPFRDVSDNDDDDDNDVDFIPDFIPEVYIPTISDNDDHVDVDVNVISNVLCDSIPDIVVQRRASKREPKRKIMADFVYSTDCDDVLPPKTKKGKVPNKSCTSK